MITSVIGWEKWIEAHRGIPEALELKALQKNERRKHKSSWTDCRISQIERRQERLGDYKKLPEDIPEFPLIRRMLLGADSVVQSLG